MRKKKALKAWIRYLCYEYVHFIIVISQLKLSLTLMKYMWETKHQFVIKQVTDWLNTNWLHGALLPHKGWLTRKSCIPLKTWHLAAVNYSQLQKCCSSLVLNNFCCFLITLIFSVCETFALDPYLLSGCNKAERFLLLPFFVSSQKNILSYVINIYPYSFGKSNFVWRPMKGIRKYWICIVVFCPE